MAIRKIVQSLFFSVMVAPQKIIKHHLRLSIMDKLKEYLKMPSTWRGIFALLGVVGVSLMPEQKEAVITAAVAALGLYEAFRKEGK